MTSLTNTGQQARAMEDVLANDIDTHHSRRPANKTPRKRKPSAFSRRKVDRAYYWMAVPAAVIFAVHPGHHVLVHELAGLRQL